MKTETKQTHTPGPWQLTDMQMSDEGRKWQINALIEVKGFHGESDCKLADVYSIESNARLIAAAPELLEELKKAHGKLVDNDLHFVRLDEKCAVCALIIKAEGK